ncbi:MAG: ANTAR domain-containing protein [Lachnospiraceae bacterium]|nr:ANTAR domain-containing protein [Lachnospiraceae bacterium]
MLDIVVAFPKLEDAKNLRKLLIRNGYDIARICDSGAQLVSAVNELDGGIVICGYRFSDMYFTEIREYLPESFQMLLLASPAKLAEHDVRDLVSVAMPFKMQDLLSTMEMMMVQYQRWKRKHKKPRARTASEKRTIDTAKELLIERNQMTEEEAYRYIQKISMDSGNNMVETAEMILDLNGKEWDL